MKDSLHGAVSLPGSKSESNRALMIAAYGGFSAAIGNLSKAHDTVLLQTLLRKVVDSQGPATVQLDGEDAGTVVRFLLPFLSGREGIWLLTGSERMRQRPIGPLVDSLRQLGAEITCLNQEGYLPVRITGKPLAGGRVDIDASQSSQFVTALLLAAPMWEKGLVLKLVGDIASQPYIGMTVAMMEHFGARVLCEGRTITVLPQAYQHIPFVVSADWSAASYWYELAALGRDSSILLKGLKRPSLQGDAVVADWYESLGVHTADEACGVRLTKGEEKAPGAGDAPLAFDFKDSPDLFPAVLVTCVALHRPAVFTGIKNLSLKESDRVTSLVTELNKLYTFINIIGGDEIRIEKSLLLDDFHNGNAVVFNTYHDHRIAMALAPLTLLFPSVSLDHPEVVAKSYPGYWGEIEPFTK